MMHIFITVLACNSLVVFLVGFIFYIVTIANIYIAFIDHFRHYDYVIQDLKQSLYHFLAGVFCNIIGITLITFCDGLLA